MIKSLLCKMRRFRRDENGTMSIEFALWFPIFFSVLGGMAELGVISARHAMLERGLDLAVREVRLRTTNPPQFDELKQIMCDRAAIIPNCDQVLTLEMRPQNLRHFVELPDMAACIDRSEEVNPANTFTPGQENELMVLRVCAKFSPIFPTSAIGARLSIDGAGDYALVSTSAYVQEPK